MPRVIRYRGRTSPIASIMNMPRLANSAPRATCASRSRSSRASNVGFGGRDERGRLFSGLLLF
jgi:hypothetical protein